MRAESIFACIFGGTVPTVAVPVVSRTPLIFLLAPWGLLYVSKRACLCSYLKRLVVVYVLKRACLCSYLKRLVVVFYVKRIFLCYCVNSLLFLYAFPDKKLRVAVLADSYAFWNCFDVDYAWLCEIR